MQTETKMTELTTRTMEQDEIIDNRTIVTAMADSEWTQFILASCVDSVDDVSEITFDGDFTGIEIAGPYDDDTMFSVQMEVINGDFWRSDGTSLANVQAKILLDSGYSVPEIIEALALVDMSEMYDALMAHESADPQ